MINEFMLLGEVITISQLSMISEEYPSITMVLQVKRLQKDEEDQMMIRFWSDKAQAIDAQRDALLNQSLLVKGRLNSRIYVSDEKEYFNIDLIGNNYQVVKEK